MTDALLGWAKAYELVTDIDGNGAVDGYDFAWFLFGLSGMLVFQGRFYIQWIASELEKRSVMPVLFWYMSSIGSLMLLVYAVFLQSPIGALGQSLNIVIYTRNLSHIWRNQGQLSKRARSAIQLLVLCAAAGSLFFVARIWLHEYYDTKSAAPGEARQVWFWLAVGLLGQGLFACRFIVQWIATERARASVVPKSFWHISIVASVFLLMSYMQRQEWVFAFGMGAGIMIYARNLWFLSQERQRRGPGGAM